MATRGFEFDSMLDGSNATPVIRDFILGSAAAHLVGDLMLMASDGYIDAVTSTTSEVTCIMQEPVASGDVSAGTTTAKAAILTPAQVWRCSMDASSTSYVIGYTKTIDTADKNTIAAADSSGGAMTLVDASELDDEGNVLGYVVFSNTTFANAA